MFCSCRCLIVGEDDEENRSLLAFLMGRVKGLITFLLSPLPLFLLLVFLVIVVFLDHHPVAALLLCFQDLFICLVYTYV